MDEDDKKEQESQGPTDAPENSEKSENSENVAAADSTTQENALEARVAALEQAIAAIADMVQNQTKPESVNSEEFVEGPTENMENSESEGKSDEFVE